MGDTSYGHHIKGVWSRLQVLNIGMLQGDTVASSDLQARYGQKIGGQVDCCDLSLRLGSGLGLGPAFWG